MTNKSKKIKTMVTRMMRTKTLTMRTTEIMERMITVTMVPKTGVTMIMVKSQPTGESEPASKLIYTFTSECLD